MKWTWLDEIVQNMIGVSVVGTYLYLVIVNRDAPLALEALVAAVLFYYGFKAYRKVKNEVAK
jgi:hypothetical protein